MLYLANHSRVHSPETHRSLEASDGYLFLNMPEEALQELLGIEDQGNPDALLGRIRVLLHMHRWKEAEKLSTQGMALHPNEDEFTVQRAFALGQLHKDAQAVQVLKAAPEWLRRTGILEYNLGCYEARLGDLSIARQCVEAAIQINAAMKKNASLDPDLEELWP